MSDPVVNVDDFASYLGNQAAATDPRAVQILSLAQSLCETEVSPLPSGAELVVIDVAERAYANPTAVRDSGLGLYSEGEGAFSDATPGAAGGGLFLTESNRRTLRRLAGTGSAFTVDLTPAAAGTGLPWWDLGVTWPSV